MSAMDNYLNVRSKRDQKERDIKCKVSHTSKEWGELNQGTWKCIGVTKEKTPSSRSNIQILRGRGFLSLEELADLIEEWRDAGRAVNQAYNKLSDTEKRLVDGSS